MPSPALGPQGCGDEAAAARALLDPAARRAVEGSLAGLRFVRNQMGYRADPADFIEPQPRPDGAGDAPVAAWTWKPVPAPAAGPVSQRGRRWELSRHREYRAQLAGRPAGEVIARAGAFLVQVHAAASPAGGAGELPAARSAGASGPGRRPVAGRGVLPCRRPGSQPGA